MRKPMERFAVCPKEGVHISGGLDFSPVLSGRIADMPDGAEIVFAPGEYHFWPDMAPARRLYISNTDSVAYPDKRIGILLENKRGLKLLGEGARLVFHGSMMVLCLLSCRDIQVSGFTIAHHCPTVIDATVFQSEASPEGTVITAGFPQVYGLRAENGRVLWESEKSPYTGAAYWQGENGLSLTQHKRANGQVKRTGEDLLFACRSVQPCGPSRLRIAYAGLREIGVGDVFQMRDTRRDTCGIHIADSCGISFSDTKVQFTCGMGMIAQNSRDLAFSHVEYAAAGKGMHSASAADMLHFSSCRGLIRVEGCAFVNPHDDPINIHGTFLILDRADGQRLTLRYGHPQTCGFPAFFAGDLLQLYDADTLLPIGRPERVLSASGPAKEDVRRMEVVLEDAPAVPPGLHVVAENVSARPDVMIEGNRFAHVPTRGILVSTGGHVYIRGNRFEHIHMHCIYIACDAGEWYESGPVQDVFIAHNRFVDCDSMAVSVEPTNTVLSETKVHRYIRIVGNEIKKLPFPPFAAKSVDGLLVEGNCVYTDADICAPLVKSVDSRVACKDNTLAAP